MTTAEFADFDAAFAELPEPELTGQSYKLYGRERRIAGPDNVGAMLAMGVERLQHSQDPRDIQTLIRYIFGPDALADFLRNGMSDKQMGVMLRWGMTNMANPGTMTLKQAVAEVEAMEALKAGKAVKKTSSAKQRPKAAKKPANSGSQS